MWAPPTGWALGATPLWSTSRPRSCPLCWNIFSPETEIFNLSTSLLSLTDLYPPAQLCLLSSIPLQQKLGHCAARRGHKVTGWRGSGGHTRGTDWAVRSAVGAPLVQRRAAAGTGAASPAPDHSGLWAEGQRTTDHILVHNLLLFGI